MKLLSTYSPAEAQVLMHGQEARLKDLLKVTFMDLLLKQVLKTIIVERQPNPKDAVATFKYVVVGRNFYTHQRLPHEEVFLSPFLADASAQILFQNLVKVGYQKAANSTYFQNQIIKSSAMQPLFYKDFFQRIFKNQSGYTQTHQGTIAYSQLKEEFTLLEETLPQLIQTDKEQALSICRKIKGNLFLLTTIDFELLKEIDTELLADLHTYSNQKPNRDSDLSGGCSGGGYSGCSSAWNSFGDCSDSFDSSCGGDSGCGGDGGSGCGGDSGGSGCSGCGGGGCGGD